MALKKQSKSTPILKSKITSCCQHFGKKIILTLIGVLIVYTTFYLGTLIQNNLKKHKFIGRAEKTERSITVTGYGKVTGSNDIAVTTLGYTNTAKEVSEAQAANKKVVDAIIAELKKMKIDEKDMKSNYSIYPEYNYTSKEGRQFAGYKVSNQVTIKIRDLNRVQNVLALAGKYGANQVSGLSFTIDDTQNLKAQARAKALVDAKEKAKYLSKSLGVKILSVTSYNEYEGGDSISPYRSDYAMEGLGGGSAPQIVTGGKDVEMNVNITYEVSPL